MVYDKKFELNHVDLTEDNIERLIEIINQQINGKIDYSNYEVIFIDDSKISGENADVFKEYEFRNKIIKRIYICVKDENKNTIIVDIYPSIYNNIYVKASNKKWFHETSNVLNNFIQTLKKQCIISYGTLGEKYFTLFCVILNIVVLLIIMPILIKLIPDGYDIYTNFIAICIVLPIMFKINDILDKAYPKVAFDFGVEQTKTFKKNRQILKWLFSSLIVPIILDVYLYFVL